MPLHRTKWLTAEKKTAKVEDFYYKVTVNEEK